MPKHAVTIAIAASRLGSATQPGIPETRSAMPARRVRSRVRARRCRSPNANAATASAAPASAAGTRSSVGAPPAGSSAASATGLATSGRTIAAAAPSRVEDKLRALETSLPDRGQGRRLVYAGPCYIVSWSIVLGNIPTAMAEANAQPHNGSTTRRRRRSTRSPSAPTDETFRPPQGDAGARAADAEAAQAEASHAPELIDEAELATRLGGDNPRAIDKAVKLGVLVPLGEHRYEVPSPTLLRAGEELARVGVPVDATLRVVEQLNRHSEGVAEAFVKLFLERVWRPFDQAGRPEERLPEVGQAIERLRPLASEALLAVFQRKMTREVEQALGRALERRR